MNGQYGQSRRDMMIHNSSSISSYKSRDRLTGNIVNITEIDDDPYRLNPLHADVVKMKKPPGRETISVPALSLDQLHNSPENIQLDELDTETLRWTNPPPGFFSPRMGEKRATERIYQSPVFTKPRILFGERVNSHSKPTTGINSSRDVTNSSTRQSENPSLNSEGKEMVNGLGVHLPTDHSLPLISVSGQYPSQVPRSSPLQSTIMNNLGKSHSNNGNRQARPILIKPSIPSPDSPTRKLSPKRVTFLDHKNTVKYL